MKHRNLPALLGVGILTLSLIGFLFSCSDSPTTVENPPEMTGTGTIDPQGDKDVLLSTVTLGDPYRGRVEVWAFDLTIEPDQVVSFDLVLVNKTDRDIFPPVHFVITAVTPNTIEVLNPDGYSYHRNPFFDFSGKLGEDNILSPDEATGRANVKFRWPDPMSFSIGFRIVIGEGPIEGMIGGVVFHDLNGDGVYSRDLEPGVPDIPVILKWASGDSANEITAHTDHFGRYGVGGLDAGVYEVTAMIPPGMTLTTPNPLLVTLVEFPDGTVTSFLEAHFGVTMHVPPFERIFGPIPVGPWSHLGTEVDTTFVVFDPGPSRPYLYYLRIEPPLTFRPVAMYLDEAEVWLNDEMIFKFECPADTLCRPPSVRPVLEPGLVIEGENRFRAKVLGSEELMVSISIEREVWWK
ncbi:MAG: hypothetical protein JSW58_11910 [Candidatus Latescibacterota bacterium]|nr:MAG: hypothetical protein JSW58_11910 [Candidatus Latescibacterota bacterium]